jgi:hypothetical protein
MICELFDDHYWGIIHKSITTVCKYSYCKEAQNLYLLAGFYTFLQAFIASDHTVAKRKPLG